ncbi:MAG: toll/interleukin-1 receptor domain-containing protein [Paludibacter sp.]|nr:toll/interleukin-1 receptor domain-containing protein [Paludibacter sp.]
MKSIFVSYSHTPPELKQKTLSLVQMLIERGLEVIIDHYDLSLGNDLNKFMSEISDDKKYSHILVICTKEYLAKSTNPKSGVGIEMNEFSKQLNDPNQEKIVPILFESGQAIDDILPEKLKNVYGVDLREEPDFNGVETEKLINHIKGIKYLKSKPKTINTLVDYAIGEYPGLPKDISGQLKQDVILRIFKDCLDIYNLMLDTKTWFNFSDHSDALEKVFEEICNSYKYVPEIDIVISTLLLLWEIYDNKPDSYNACRVISKAQSISDEYQKDANYEFRNLEIRYKLGITFHRLNNYEVALENYAEVMKEDSQDILQDSSPDYVFNSALYSAHIYMLTGQTQNALDLYRSVIVSCEKAFEHDLPNELFVKIRNIYYCALYSIKDKSDEDLAKLSRLESINDEDFCWYKTFCKSYYPRLFGLKILLIPEVKPEIDGFVEGIHYKYL